MKVITLHVNEKDIEGLHDLVREGYYPSRADAIRNAIRDLLIFHGKLGRGDVHG